jgi:hypothetical protein
MKKPRFLPLSGAIGLSLVLFAVLIAACAPATSTVPLAASPSAEPSLVPSPTALVQATPSVDLTATYTLELLSATPPSDAQPVGVATSRGPNLEATGPTTVNLASGGLQLVEFFRFT